GAANLSLAEKSSMALISQAFGLVSAGADRYGCDFMVGEYQFSLDVNVDGDGQLRVDDTVLTVTSLVDDARGTLLAIGMLDGAELGPVLFHELVGDASFSFPGSVLLLESSFRLSLPGSSQIRHEYKVIEDIYPAMVFGGLEGVTGRGLALLSKVEAPRAKWRHWWQYYRVEEFLGAFSRNAVEVRHDNAAACNTQLSFGLVNDFAAGIQIEGTLRVVR
ncbi:MAG: hypothetical protein KDK91_32395, partial [Gammaproteobacteria bacterium]|nr:hypothetical protein [Gammaproteobacteria bacterium]